MATDCIEHRGRIAGGGYGQVQLPSGEHMQAHRLAYMAVHGRIPDGMIVCHRCDNPPCVNPAHLFLGTHADNSADMVAKGRSLRGVKNPKASLTEERVLEIRRAYAAGASARELAEQYGLSHAYVERLVAGRVWRHVPIGPKKQGGWKVTPERASEIRRLAGAGVAQNKLAERFGVTAATISRVVSGKSCPAGEVCHGY